MKKRVYAVRVAPVRERGLKLQHLLLLISFARRRSREGAWIEIPDARLQRPEYLGRSREGAWIEIKSCRQTPE